MTENALQPQQQQVEISFSPSCNVHNAAERDSLVLHEIIRIRAAPLTCFASHAQRHGRGDGLLKVCVMARVLEQHRLPRRTEGDSPPSPGPLVPSSLRAVQRNQMARENCGAISA